MEFKFRAVDDQSSNTVPSSSSGFKPPSSDQIFRPNSNLIRSRPETVELEKLQIREEIIASEMARRIALEAEVRRELVEEWEMAAMHRVREMGLSYEQSLTMHLDPRLPLAPHFLSLNRWRPEACFNLLPPSSTLLPSPVLLPPPLTQVLESEAKDALEEKKNRLIIMPKPDPNRVVGAKWKTPPPAGTTEKKHAPTAMDEVEKKSKDSLEKKHAPTVIDVVEMTPELRKKKKLKFSCEICAVDVNSEVIMETHKKGRKHRARLLEIGKSNVAALATTATTDTVTKQATSNNDQLPKVTDVASDDGKLMDIPKEKNSNTSINTNTVTLPEKIKQLDEKLEDYGKIKDEKDEQLIMREGKAERFTEKKIVDSIEKEHATTVMDAVEMTPELRRKKKLKFWCEICSIGVNSEVVMETHKKGRKHRAQLLEIGKSNVAALAATTTDIVTKRATSNVAQILKVADEVSDEAKLMDVPNAEKL